MQGRSHFFCPVPNNGPRFELGTLYFSRKKVGRRQGSKNRTQELSPDEKQAELDRRNESSRNYRAREKEEKERLQLENKELKEEIRSYRDQEDKVVTLERENEALKQYVRYLEDQLDTYNIEFVRAGLKSFNWNMLKRSTQ